jgi:uncharacterized iron-regulated membrane protein
MQICLVYQTDMKISDWRKIHRIVAVAILVPLIIISVTGLILLVRNQFEFLQPSVLKNKIVAGKQLLTLERITQQFGQDKIEQIIFRPSKNSIVVRLTDTNEVQIHPQSGQVLKNAKRRTHFLIELHQGSWMGAFGQLGVHFFTGIGLCFLIISGIIIYPFKRKNS